MCCITLISSGCGGGAQSLTAPVVPLEIAQQPANVSAPLGSTAIFTVRAGGGTGTLSYQWSKSGSAIPGAVGTSYTTEPVAASDSGAVYTVSVSDQGASVESSGATLTVAARSPMAGDLRFQLVDAPATANTAYEVPLAILYPYIWTFPSKLGTPLRLGLGQCVPGAPQDCEWAFMTYGLPSGAAATTVSYEADVRENLAQDLTALPPATVVTSLDVESGEDVFGWSAQTGQSGGFDLRHEAAAVSALPAAVAADGTQSRVVTAISFNDATGSVDFLSYGWASDKSTSYDTQVSTASYDNIGPAATALANGGYIITAFGGNAPDGYILIGTKVHGDTLPRLLLVSPETSSVENYALVGWAVNDPYLSNGSPPVWLFER